MKLKRGGKFYEFVEEVVLDYQWDPYIWMSLVIGRGVFFGFFFWLLSYMEFFPWQRNGVL